MQTEVVDGIADRKGCCIARLTVNGTMHTTNIPRKYTVTTIMVKTSRCIETRVFFVRIC